MFESLYIKRPTIRKHPVRHRPVRKHIVYENVQTYPNLYKKYKGRSRLYENIISTWKSNPNHRGRKSRCRKKCNASQTYSKHKYYILKRIFTMSSAWKRTNIYNSKRKSVSQGSISKNLFGKLANLFESSYIKRPAVRKHAARHRPVRNDKDSIRKSTNIKKSWRKSKRDEAVCKKA